MKPELDPPSAHRVNAVLGWLELGNPAEAKIEFDSLPAPLRGRHEMVELLWMILARLERWDDALGAAEKLLEMKPGDSSSWLHRAYALRRASSGTVEKARAALEPAAALFPEEPVIPYNLACYDCVLGDLEQARAWLAEARKRGKASEIDALARRDPDLAALWPELGVR